MKLVNQRVRFGIAVLHGLPLYEFNGRLGVYVRLCSFPIYSFTGRAVTRRRSASLDGRGTGCGTRSRWPNEPLDGSVANLSLQVQEASSTGHAVELLTLDRVCGDASYIWIRHIPWVDGTPLNTFMPRRGHLESHSQFSFPNVGVRISGSREH